MNENKDLSVIKKSESIGKKSVEIVEVGKIYFQDDPRRISQRIKNHLELNKDFSFQGLIRSFKEMSQWTEEDFKDDPVDVLDIQQLENFVLEDLEAQFNKVPESTDSLLQVGRKTLLYTFEFTRLRSLTKENKKAYAIVVLPESINVLTEYYVQNTLHNLPQEIAILEQTFTQEEVQTVLTHMTAIAILSGYFTENTPENEAKKKLLSKYIPHSAPRFVREIIPPNEQSEIEAERLALLKGYWNKAFIQRWVATARLHYDGIRTLSLKDQQIANQDIPTDPRQSESRAGAKSQSEKLYARSGSVSKAQQAIESYDVDTERLRRVEKEKRNALIESSNTLILAYNPNHFSLVDEKLRPIGQWGILKNKSFLLFETFFREAHELNKKSLTHQEQQTILQKTAESLIQVLSRGNEKNNLDPQQLFGPDFLRLSAIEQICLIIFSSLSLRGQEKETHPVVNLLSHALIPMLDAQSSFSKPTSEEAKTITEQKADHIPFNLNDLNLKKTVARLKLTQLTTDHGLISANDDLVHEEFDKQYQLSKVVQELNELLPNAIPYRHARLISFILLSFLSTYWLNLSLTLENNPFSILSLLISTSALIFSGSVAPRKDYLLSNKNQLKSEINSTNLLENSALNKQLQELDEKFQKKNKRFSTKWGLICLLAFSIPLGGIQAIKHANENIVDDTSELSQITGELPQIPDQLDQEALRDLPHVLRGEIIALPDFYQDTEGERIGYLPQGWYTPGGGSVFR